MRQKNECEAHEVVHWCGEAQCVWSSHCMSEGGCRPSSCQGQGRRSVCPGHTPSLRKHTASQIQHHTVSNTHVQISAAYIVTCGGKVMTYNTQKTHVHRLYTYSPECVLQAGIPVFSTN